MYVNMLIPVWVCYGVPGRRFSYRDVFHSSKQFKPIHVASWIMLKALYINKSD